MEPGAEARWRPYALFTVWIASAAALVLLTAPNFLALLSQSLNSTFGTVFPAIPFAALLTLIFALRWGDLRDLLAEERTLTSEPLIRASGVASLALLVLVRGLTGESVVSAGVAVVATFYAMSLVLIPVAKRFVLPYAVTYMAGVAVPFIMQWAFGQPLVALSSYLSARLVAVVGIPVTWQGPQFTLVSRSGGTVVATVTPGCSSIISVTTFLGLLALMHFDLKKEVAPTVRLAAVGVVALTLLNSMRIAILIWVGYSMGAGALWYVHNWVGYAIFIGFYVVALVFYTRMGPRGVAPRPGTALPSPTLKRSNYFERPPNSAV